MMKPRAAKLRRAARRAKKAARAGAPSESAIYDGSRFLGEVNTSDGVFFKATNAAGKSLGKRFPTAREAMRAVTDAGRSGLVDTTTTATA